MMTKRCETGCKVFDGGERRHHRDCAFYQGSFTEMFDTLESEIERLRAALKQIADFPANDYPIDAAIPLTGMVVTARQALQ